MNNSMRKKNNAQEQVKINHSPSVIVRNDQNQSNKLLISILNVEHLKVETRSILKKHQTTKN